MKYWAQGAWHDRDEPAPERVQHVTDIDHPGVRWRCKAPHRCSCGNEAYAEKYCAHFEPLPAPECKHLNLRLVRTNNCGLPFDCLDCGAKELPWTALNGLLAELNAVLRGK